ncbi:hypothetical protein IC763_06040 [Acinetobacter seifertii]|nr:hypothetical protein IC763_06040 [Acinetobacter seifertii]
MSEFKEGDWLTSKSHAGLLIFYKYIGEKAFVDVISRSGKSTGLSAYKLSELEHASEAEIKAGHRIDEVVPVYAKVKFPYNVLTGEQVGAVMNATHIGCDLGDDFPIENHISPNCKAKDV